MINIKTPAEIDAMRTGGAILANILEEIKAYTQAGMTTHRLNEYAETLFAKYSVIPSFKGYQGFPAAICTAINDEVVHGIPNNAVIKTGDIIGVDAGVFYKNLHTDSAITFAVGSVSPIAQMLINETTNALWAGINMVKPGNQIGDVSYAIYNHLKKHNITVIPELIGHGVGHKLHEEPQVPNIGKQHSGPTLKPGMTFAIEPITCLGKRNIETLSDKWTIVTKDGSLACQQEHTVLVTTTGVEVLTEKKAFTNS